MTASICLGSESSSSWSHWSYSIHGLCLRDLLNSAISIGSHAASILAGSGRNALPKAMELQVSSLSSILFNVKDVSDAKPGGTERSSTWLPVEQMLTYSCPIFTAKKKERLSEC